VWDLTTGEEARSPLHGSDFPVSSVAFSPDGHLIAGASDKIYVWDADSGEPVEALGGYGGAAMSVAFSPDGGRIAAAGTDGTVRPAAWTPRCPGTWSPCWRCRRESGSQSWSECAGRRRGPPATR
jgi:WD40 repeat protein